MKLFFLLAALLSFSASSLLYAELGLDRESQMAAALHKSWQNPQVKDSLRRAITLYPSLGKEGTALHREFLKGTFELAPQNLSNPNWPILLAVSMASKMGITPSAIQVRARVEPARQKSGIPSDTVENRELTREEIERLNLRSIKRGISGAIESGIAPDGVRVGLDGERSFAEELSLEKARKLPQRRKRMGNREAENVAVNFEKAYFAENGVYPPEADVQEEVRKEIQTQQILHELRALRDEVSSLRTERRQ